MQENTVYTKVVVSRYYLNILYLTSDYTEYLSAILETKYKQKFVCILNFVYFHIVFTSAFKSFCADSWNKWRKES